MDPLHSPVPDSLLPELDHLLTIGEVADYLYIPKQTIYDWRVDGRGPRAYKMRDALDQRKR